MFWYLDIYITASDQSYGHMSSYLRGRLISAVPEPNGSRGGGWHSSFLENSSFSSEKLTKKISNNVVASWCFSRALFILTLKNNALDEQRLHLR